MVESFIVNEKRIAHVISGIFALLPWLQDMESTPTLAFNTFSIKVGAC
jgi:hypothetical protein